MLERINELLWSNARKYAFGALEAEDLYQEQVAKVLELQNDMTGKEPHFIQTVVKSCRNCCVSLYRKEKLRGCGASLEDDLEDIPNIAETYSDGSFEKYRRELEFNERFSMLSALDRRVIHEILNPSDRTELAEREEHDALFELILEGRPVRNRSGMESTARHVARGLNMPLRDIRKSVGRIKAAFVH